jgi:MFS family permease
LSSTASEPAATPAKRVSGFAAFSHPDYRLYFFGQLVSISGTWMQQIAQQIIVYQLTGSESTLGLVACVQGLPALLLMPFSGVLIDRFSNRKLLIVTQFWLMSLALILAALSFTNTLQIWHVAVLAFAAGVGNAIDAPARQVYVVELVGKEHLTSGIIMNSLMFNTARVLGPVFAGFALRLVGPSWCFLLNGLSFLAVLLSLFLIHSDSKGKGGGNLKFLEPFVQGLRFARSDPTIRPLLLGAVASAFGIVYSVLVTPFADHVLGDVTNGTSAMLTSAGVGTIIAAALNATVFNGGIKRGKILMIVAFMGPVSLILLSGAQTLFTALLFTGIASGAFICHFILTNTLIQTNVPDEYRGRVLSLYTLTFFGLSPFGSLALGALAEATSTPFALLFCGSITLVSIAVIFGNARHLWRTG